MNLRRKYRGELAVCSLRKSRNFRRISLPRARAAVENTARDEVSIDPSSTNYFDTRLTVFDHTLRDYRYVKMACYLRSLRLISQITLCV